VTTESAPSSTMSPYERLGGEVSIQAAVELFYHRLVADPTLRDYFADLDLVQLKRHQALFLGQLLGGPAAYAGRSLAQAHAGLDITAVDFQAVGAHLIGVLNELGAPTDIVAAVNEALAAVAGDIITASPEADASGVE
jgi:hemoglobin